MKKETLASVTGTVSGVAGILGSWQVCHTVCLGLISMLSVVGITVVGMPLAFLTKLAIPFWTIAVITLGITGLIYVRKKCFSKHLLTMNFGFIIAGVPFPSWQKYSIFFWALGGTIALASIILLIKPKIQKAKYGNHC